jgi:hypothetical protein
MKTFTKIFFLAALMVFTTSLIAQQSMVNQTGATNIDKLEMIQQLHGPTVKVPLQLEGMTRATGDDCTDPIVIGAFPYSDIGQTTAGRGNVYDQTCLNDFDGGEDIIYEFTLLSATTIYVELDPKGTAHTGMAVSDDCGFQGVCLGIAYDIYGGGANPIGFTAELDPGVYYIIVDTWPMPASIPDFDLSISEVTTVANDDCANAIAIEEVTNMFFSTLLATDDGDCTDGANIWYDYTPTFTGDAIISLCGSEYDTQLGVFDGAACPPVTNLDCNDDFCDLQSQVSVSVVQGNVYKIEIGGWFGDSGEGYLTIYEDVLCDIPCPPTGTPENEPCGDDLNGGCNMATPAYINMMDGDEYCGNLWSEFGIRDTDWYKIVLTNPANVRFSVNTEGPTIFGFVAQLELGVPGCNNLSSFFSNYTELVQCSEGFVESALLPIGTYYVMVAPNDFYSYACPGFDYVATLEITDIETGHINAQVLGSDVAIGIGGVKVTAGDYYSKTTNALGLCLIEVPVGTYSVAADGNEVNYSSATKTNIIVTEGNVTNVQFVLDPLEAPVLLTAVADVEEVSLTWAPIAPPKGERTLMGEILLNNEYVPGTTMDLEFTLSIYSPDFEWGEYCEIVLPPQFVPQSASNLPGLFPGPGFEIEPVIDGQKVYWTEPGNYFYSSNLPEEIVFTVEVAIDGAATGPYMLDYYVEGDGYGLDPHFFEGFVTAYQSGGTYVPTYNLYRRMEVPGTQFIWIAKGIVGTEYVDEIYPGGDTWCYYVTQILANGEESPMSNILCATPLIRPGSLCENAIDYGQVNDPALAEALVRETDVRWFEFDVPYTMDIIVDVCNSNFNTQLAIYEDCNDFNGTLPVDDLFLQGAIAYNDDSELCGPMSLQSGILFEYFPGGTYYAAVYGQDGEFGDLEILIQQVQYFHIRDNWSGISIYMEPAGSANIADVLSEFEPNMTITVRPNPYGIWWPSQNINTLGNLTTEIGYKSKMVIEDYTIIYGTETANKTVNLPVGASYLPMRVTVPVSADDVATALGNDMLIIFDMYNNSLIWPGGGLNTLDWLIPDYSYLISMVNASSYTFDMPTMSPAPVIPQKPEVARVDGWNDVANTGIVHFISLTTDAQKNFVNGDFVGVFNPEGICVGVAEYTGDGANMFLPAYGDDEVSDDKDGLLEGENMSYKMNRNGVVYQLTATYNMQMPNNDGTFAINGMSQIVEFKLSPTAIGESELSSLSIYPNPSTGVFNIDGISNTVEMVVSNAHGQVVYTNSIGENTLLDLSSQPKGIYFVELRSENSVKIEKIVLR